MCATDGLRASFRKAEVLNLPLLNQVLHGSRDVFDRHVRVNTVLVEEVDGINLESLQRGLGDVLDVIRPTVDARKRINVEPELGGYYHFRTEGGESFTHEFFVRERPVCFGGVEECNAVFDSRPNQRDHLLLVSSRAVTIAHPHAAEPHGRNFQIAASQFTFLHFSSYNC